MRRDVQHAVRNNGACVRSLVEHLTDNARCFESFDADAGNLRKAVGCEARYALERIVADRNHVVDGCKRGKRCILECGLADADNAVHTLNARQGFAAFEQAGRDFRRIMIYNDACKRFAEAERAAAPNLEFVGKRCRRKICVAECVCADIYNVCKVNCGYAAVFERRGTDAGNGVRIGDVFNLRKICEAVVCDFAYARGNLNADQNIRNVVVHAVLNDRVAVFVRVRTEEFAERHIAVVRHFFKTAATRKHAVAVSGNRNRERDSFQSRSVSESVGADFGELGKADARVFGADNEFRKINAAVKRRFADSHDVVGQGNFGEERAVFESVSRNLRNGNLGNRQFFFVGKFDDARNGDFGVVCNAVIGKPSKAAVLGDVVYRAPHRNGFDAGKHVPFFLGESAGFVGQTIEDVAERVFPADKFIEFACVCAKREHSVCLNVLNFVKFVFRGDFEQVFLAEDRNVQAYGAVVLSDLNQIAVCFPDGFVADVGGALHFFHF